MGILANFSNLIAWILDEGREHDARASTEPTGSEWASNTETEDSDLGTGIDPDG